MSSSSCVLFAGGLSSSSSLFSGVVPGGFGSLSVFSFLFLHRRSAAALVVGRLVDFSRLNIFLR